MQPLEILGPFLLISGTLLLIATEIAILYRPDIQAVGLVFGIFFVILGARIQFTNNAFSSFTSAQTIAISFFVQLAVGFTIFYITHTTMQRLKPYLIDKLNPPYPDQ